MRERQVLGNGLKLDARPAPCWPSDDRYLDLAYPTTRRKRSILLDFEQQGLQLVPLQFGVPLGFKHSGPVGRVAPKQIVHFHGLSCFVPLPQPFSSSDR
jgi:hypothetical protein